MRKRAYRDLSGFSIRIAEEADGWHVDYELKDERARGGGPHYVIHPSAEDPKETIPAIAGRTLDGHAIPEIRGLPPPCRVHRLARLGAARRSADRTSSTFWRFLPQSIT